MLHVRLVGKQTLADAALVGVHPVGAPQADAISQSCAVPVFCLNTQPVCSKDERFDTLGTDAVVVLDTLSLNDTRRRVEAD